MQLYGRDAELAALNDLLDRAREGISGALVLRGDAGIGKTALLAQVTEQAGGFQVIRVTGIAEEAELPFAGLHLLLRSALDRVSVLPGVQAEALRGALGLAKAGPPDRFLVGLAVLSLLAELAADRPLLCVADDAQWLDRASADALLFAARRLDTESVVMLFGARPGGFPAAGLPELILQGLSAQAATELLDDGQPSSRRYRVLAEAGSDGCRPRCSTPGARRRTADVTRRRATLSPRGCDWLATPGSSAWRTLSPSRSRCWPRRAAMRSSAMNWPTRGCARRAGLPGPCRGPARRWVCSTSVSVAPSRP
jgi:hypothetical protein